MEVSAVKLRNSYQVCYIDTNNIFIKNNSLCILETEHGLDLGRVVKRNSRLRGNNCQVKGKLIRKVTDEDIKRLPDIEAIEEKAFNTCKEKARNKNLEMKLISVKCLFDKTKIIFYFVAENRIDFRELVRELASVFRTRIEMRQIGVRDEARLVGGFGQCGREHCCGHQHDDFEPVSIKMAKEQSLNLNSLKISGMCGRLLCCLGYEYPIYKELNANLPKNGAEIFAENKTYTVISFDSLSETIRVKDGDRIIRLSKSDIKFVGNRYVIKKEVIDMILNEDDISENDGN